MYIDYQTLNANVMQLHSFCSAFGIQRKEKKRKVYIYTHILTNVRICVLGRKLRFLDTHRAMTCFLWFWGWRALHAL